MESLAFWAPLVVVAAGAGVCGFFEDRLRSREELLLRHGLSRTRSEAALRYFNEVHDSSD